MSLSLFLQSIAIGFFPFLSKIHEFIIVKGVGNISQTIRKSIKDALLADTFNKKIRAKVMAKLGTVFPMSRVLGMIIGFVLLTYLSLVYTFYFCALLVLFVAIFFFLFYKEKVYKRISWKFSSRAYSRNIKIISLIAFFISLNFTIAYLPAFFILANSLSIETNTLFILFLGSYLISSAFTYWSKNWIDKFGRIKTLFFSILGFSIIMFFYAFTVDIVQMFIVLAGVSVFYYIGRIALKTVMMDNTSKPNRGEQIGFIKSIEGIGDVAGPAIGGFLIEFVSLSSTFVVASAVGIVGAILVFHLK